MEILRKIVSLAFFIIVVSTYSFAQKSAPRKPQTVDEMVERLEPRIKDWSKRDALRMKQILALSDEQVKLAEAIRASYVREIFRMKFESSKKQSDNSKRFNKNLIEMLNPQQQETFKQRRKDIFPKG